MARESDSVFVALVPRAIKFPPRTLFFFLLPKFCFAENVGSECKGTLFYISEVVHPL